MDEFRTAPPLPAMRGHNVDICVDYVPDDGPYTDEQSYSFGEPDREISTPTRFDPSSMKTCRKYSAKNPLPLSRTNNQFRLRGTNQAPSYRRLVKTERHTEIVTRIDDVYASMLLYLYVFRSLERLTEPRFCQDV